MAATIEMRGERATIDGYRWRSRDKTLQSFLNSLLDPLGASGADPDPDLTAANAAVDELGAILISKDKPEAAPRGRPLVH